LLLALLAGSVVPAAGVQRVSDLNYAADGLDAHRLDLFLPPDRAHAAIVIFVHGGAFMQGTRQEYASVGQALARQGIATAVVSYRLFPQSDAEGAVQDVARATSWMIARAADYGLDGRNLFLVGHSAGAQIIAVIATSPRYLQTFSTPLSAIRGVFAVSGAYDVRDLSGEPDSWQKVDGHIYGETPAARAAFSPATNIDPQTPPIVTACGTRDDPDSCNRATHFVAALSAAGIASTTIQENGADHMGMLRALTDPKDPLNAALLYFIAKEKP
jgi:acetyl esterase/lipase